MRLLDKLLSDEFNAGHLVDRARVIDSLSVSQLVVADNVAEYWLRCRNHDLPIASDFPNIMLPFEHTFIEMRFPRSTEIGNFLEAGGLLLNMSKRLDPVHEPGEDAWLYGPDVAYHLKGLYFFQPRGKSPVVMSNFALAVNQYGYLVSSEGGKKCDFTIHPLRHLDIESEEKNQVQFHSEILTPTIYPALLALSFMHCRNVKVTEEIPVPKLSKKHERKTGKPLLRYHVLKIDHIKATLEREGHASTDGLKQALHICRGHFKHYGRDGKGLLFGKYTATVWIPMHARGSAEEGLVVKDYDVK